MKFYKNSIYKAISSVLYLAVGLLLIFTNALLPASNSSKRMLGIIILAYGIFRAVSGFTTAIKK